MHTNKITSLPIFSHNSTEVVSIVNLFDILIYLVGRNDKHIEKEKLKVNDPIERVLGLDFDRESYRIHKVHFEDRLLETLHAFASGNHRALVIDFNQQEKKPWILSQTDIIRYILNHPDSVSGLLDLDSCAQTLISNQALVTVPETETVLDVYRLLADNNLSAVPVVNSHGEFKGNICVEDLPSANLEHIDQLALSCQEYTKVAPSHLLPATATPDTDLKDILDNMIKRDTHRVWILDTNKVIGVVTMSDIMSLLCRHPKPNLF
ncbi:hypothetical protein BD560DRAFT_334880 [Blakeslea trispora]|nr:hypothetical protein BD560DRAFT_334880 [Blakeslea trispora]